MRLVPVVRGAGVDLQRHAERSGWKRRVGHHLAGDRDGRIDLGGLDVFYNISTYLFDDMDNGTGPSPLLAEKVREGNLGAKTGQGFFSWQGEDGKRIIESRNKALLRALKNDAADAAAAQA